MADRLRIALALGYYEIGGFKTVIDNLALRLSRAGHDVTVFARVIRVKPPPGINLVKATPQEFLKETRQFDIIHIHTSYPYLKILVDNNTLDNVVFTYHGYTPWYQVPGLTNKAISIYLLMAYKRSLKNVKIITAVSNYVKEQVKRLFKRDATVIYNGVDLSIFRLTQNITNGEKSIIIFNATAWDKLKGLDLLIKYYKVIKKYYPNAKLIMVSKAPIDYDHDIQILQPMNQQELVKYYSTATFYLLTSRHESFGLPIIESFACGTPVIAWDRPDARREHIINSGAGYLFRNEEELINAVKEVLERRHELSQKAINYARQFDWERIISNYLKIYTTLTNNA